MHLLFAVLLLSLPVQAANGDWTERFNEDGITIHSRPVAGSRYQEFRATVELDAASSHAVALLQDNGACARWVFRCRSSENIEEISNTERYFHQVTDLPFPFRARDAIFHGEIFYGPNEDITIRIGAAPDKQPPKKRLVRIRETYGHYLLEPLGNGKVRLTWQHYVDPAGVLPAWLVNSMLTDLPSRSLASFRDLVKEAPYRNAVFRYNDLGIPIEIEYCPESPSPECTP